MANPINEVILTNVRDLITKITGYEGGSDQFANLEKYVITTLKKSDTMYFLNTKDIKKAIWSMADKFMFHSFFKHADYLKQVHDKYIDKNLSESELTPRLNVVKFLLCMSENPTTHFWKEPEKFEFIEQGDSEGEVIDWGAYLNEGIERWSPINDDSFQDNSDSDDETDYVETQTTGGSTSRTVITETNQVELYDFKAVRSKLLESVQNGWFNGDVICMKPPSDWFDANVGILWEQHLRSQIHNLVEIDEVTVISEYKVMREVMWQMWGPHTSTVYELKINKLVPKSNVTISSVRSITFESFLEVFVPYIEVLDEFRQFYLLLEGAGIPETYKSYGCVLKQIMGPVFEKLLEIENEIREQETTMTLLKLAQRLEKIFEPVRILKVVHQEVIGDNFQNSTPLKSALTLLTRLRRSLQFSLTKMDQDIRLTLYLQSLYYYFTMVNAWLVKNDLFDHTGEFIILDKNVKNSKVQEHQMNFVLQDDIETFCEEDGIIGIIADQVLQIGRNIHFLRLLGKYGMFTKGLETIHQEFIRRFLAELSLYYECEVDNANDESPKLKKVVTTFDINGMGDWTNFVDMSDGLLAKAFDDFYLEKVEPVKEPTLFEKISKITANLFPMQNIPEKIFTQILKDRFTVSGLMVKNLLIENYNLDKQFEFMNHIFLFWDDTIFPFHRRLFEKMTTPNSNWGNSVWLTSHLQDIIMDLYPNFYEDCTVQVKDTWKHCRDSLEACTLLSIKYDIRWPLSIIITNEHVVMYKELFEFILKIKWALYTINHLYFTDLEPRNKSKKAPSSPPAIKRLKYLKFNLINILNSIQHYLFGFVFTKHRIQFELDFEKSNDLKSLISSHEAFVKSIHRAVAEIRDKKRNHHGFNTLMKCVKMLKVMWSQLEHATPENLDNCRKIYRSSFDVINPIVNPVFVFSH